MPPKAKPTATAAKAIQKRSSRPAAAAAVKAATGNLLPQRRGAASPPVQLQPRSGSPPTSIGGGDERIGALELQNRALLESLDEVKERDDELMDLFTSLRSVLFNYGSLDLFCAVDLGLTSQKRGRFPSTLRR